MVRILQSLIRTLTRSYAGVAAVLILISLPASGVVAAVTFFGSVSPDPPGDGNVESTLTVGLKGDDDADFRGYVLVEGGTQIEYDALVVGKDAGYQGEVQIRGTLTPGGQSRLDLEEGGSTSAPTVQIGREGVGRLTIEAGGSMLLLNTVADLTLGVEPAGVGTMAVTGALSLAVIPDTHIIGNRGIGRLEILDGGVVRNTDTNNTTLIGATAGSVGTVLVDGPGSIWKIDDSLTVGASGIGTLTVSNQGFVDIDQAGATTTIGAKGRLELADGLFSGTLITLNGTLGGSGLVRGNLTGSAGSLIDVPADGHLQFTGAVTNRGTLSIREGEASFLAGFDNLATDSDTAAGRVSLESGRIRFSETLANGGVIAVTSGTSHLHGAINNQADATILLASHAIGTFYDDVDIGPGTLELLAGANGLFLSDLSFATDGLLGVQMDDGGAELAQLFVGGAASLAGGLEFGLVGSNRLEKGDSFPLLYASGGVNGRFDTVTLPELAAGLSWRLDYGENQVVLEVKEAAAADFDADGDVDGDDLALWEADFGRSGSNADADADGDADGVDFLVWQRQFGGGNEPHAVSQAVPEPSTIVLLAGLLLGLLTQHKPCRVSFSSSENAGK